MATPRLSANLLRFTCPIVVFAYLVWQAVASANWNLALCLLALLLTLAGGVPVIQGATRRCENAAPGERKAKLDLALRMTKQLGGVFCGMVLAVGLCYTLETARFFALALPLILSGWGAMLWIIRRTFRTL